jgi:hypothetical protein
MNRRKPCIKIFPEICTGLAGVQANTDACTSANGGLDFGRVLA